MKILISTFLVTILCLAGSTNVIAQDDGMLVIPVELFTCNYNEGKDSGDLDGVIAIGISGRTKKG